MNWQAITDKIKSELVAMGVLPIDATYNLLQDYGNVAVLVNGNNRYRIVAPDGKTLSEPSINDIQSQDRMNYLLEQAKKVVNSGYMKDSKGDLVPVVIAPNGQSFPSTDYKNQGATYDATGQPSQNTPTSGAGTATPPTTTPTSTLTAATVPNSTPTQITIKKGNDTMQIMSSDLSYWQSQGWAQGKTGTASSAPATPTGTQGAAGTAGAGATGAPITIWNGTSSMQVMPSDLSYWQSQGWSQTQGATSPNQQIADMIAAAVGNPDATDEEILAAVTKLKNEQIDPYYKQLLTQAQSDVVSNINKAAEDRVRALQTEALTTAKNIENTQKNLEASGLTFSGEAIKNLGALSAFGAPTATAPLAGQDLTAKQTMPTMTPQQMGLEGTVNTANRLMTESSRSDYAKWVRDTEQAALRQMGTAGVAGLGLTTLTGEPDTVGSIEYARKNALLSAANSIAGSQATAKLDYQQLFA
jgi:hypothetical protein